MKELAWHRSPLLQMTFATGICVSVALLAWFGFRASREWQRSSSMLVERRADEAAGLFATALSRDMRAVQTDVLVAREWDHYRVGQAQDVITLIASAFARYPYPDSFFAMVVDAAPGDAMFFLRADRPALWSAAVPNAARYPVRLEHAPLIAESIEARIASDLTAGRLWSVFDVQLGDRVHQVVARLEYTDSLNQQLKAVYGFTVDLQWVREHYYSEITRQVQRISGGSAGLALAIVDDVDATVAATSEAPLTGHISRRTFPVLFVDPRVIALNPPSAQPSRSWTVLASAAADPTLAAAIAGARWTVVLAAAAAVTLAVGLLLSARAIRAWGSIAELRAEFMASVTHELKTPISAIQALAQTFVGGRVAFHAQREYGTLIVRETRQLSRLVDNLLAHARITDVADVYSFEPLDVEVLIRESAGMLNQHVRQAGISLDIDTEPDLPAIHADQAAMALLLDNLLDNAIRYSGTSRTVNITAARTGQAVRICVADRGMGIAPEDLDRVVQKFVRARNAPPGGSGLGLAIVKRIVDDHRGRLQIESTLNQGTVVAVEMPVCLEDEAGRTDRPRRRA